MNHIQLTLLFVYILIALFASIFMLICIAEGNRFALLPNEIKELKDVNWFGAIVLFIVMLFSFPLVYLYLLLGFIFKSRLPKH
jgi:hypothetical protein